MFRDRTEAGEVLAEKLARYAGRGGVVVLALPRGGVPVGYEVAAALGTPLDAFAVRKLGVPWHRELAMGAIASGGVRVLNQDVIRSLGISDEIIEAVAEQEGMELERREAAYRDGRPAPEVAGKAVILVDDGLATGSTMRAAVAALRLQEPARIVGAVPIAARMVCEELRQVVDEMVCSAVPDSFHAVGLWYEDFRPTTDQEVQALLSQAARRRPAERSTPEAC